MRNTVSEFRASRGLDLEQALARLQAQGIKATAERTLRELATAYGYDRPIALIDIMEDRRPE